MKKKILITSFASIFLIPSAFADQSRPTFNGFYAGLCAGLLQSDATINTNLSANQKLKITFEFLPDAPFSLPEDINVGQSAREVENSLMINGLLGYGHVVARRFYAGIEGFGNWGQRDFDPVNLDVIQNENNILGILNFDTTSNSTTEVSLKPVEYGGDLRLGFITNSMTTMIFGKIGAAFNQLHLSTTNTTIGNLGTPITSTVSLNSTSTMAASEDKNVTGLQWGFGIEQLINCHWSVRADYTHTDYGDIHTQANGVTSPGFVNFSTPITGNITVVVNPVTNTLSQNAEAHVKANAVTLGLSYYF